MFLNVFDDNNTSHFYPICHTRSIGDLRCGILKLRQSLEHAFDADATSVFVEPALADIYRERHPDWNVNLAVKQDVTHVNSRLILNTMLVDQIKSMKQESCLVCEDTIVALRSSKPVSSFSEIQATLATDKVVPITVAATFYRSLSEIIHANPQRILADFEEHFYDQENYLETEPGVTLLHPYNIWLGEGVVLKPGVVLDASDGPIVIDCEAQVMHNSVILGPVYIGKKSIIKVGAKIYHGTSIGPVCKVGGEVEGSIIQAYSNKQHDGFLGHSYLGEWVNIGADTNNSDLKNNYKNVFYHSYAEAQKVDSGTQFLGAVIADHVKIGINCSINTGCVIGTGSNIYGSDLISDFIPDFSWGMAQQLSKYRIEAFMQTAEAVKARRGLQLSSAERSLFIGLTSQGS
ncbi:MAG: hypothetical protein CVU48_03960 [Candidatus Cloacimonetes bacterium HGW-Cloacimonetes-1]|nr:MAG: hypothetical protein CVU48_03960 [Candidatus Cloacimonetes bacterium HGW-Cloacimonetes-1]